MLYKLHRVWLIISFASLCGILYGIVFAIWEMENNSCRMTYMFEYPQFVRIHFEENAKFPRYGLYAYSEGYLTKEVRSMKFTGAPVIFIPGNGGSYKQARSLASVAIRKGIDNDWNQHLDYFSVDFNEEYSALFGGFLDSQKKFIQMCITAVLKLYKDLYNAPKQVILIGHSMGGKVAQSVLIEDEYFNYINTIISIASPLDRPVINIDHFFEDFYNRVENTFSQRRSTYVNSTTNYCITLPEVSVKKPLDKVLLISIGGGARDTMVHADLTHSKYTDIHAMTTSIPNVWLSTDHLCSVWCLQLVLVVNRFLYSIIADTKTQYKSAHRFIDEKEYTFKKARHYFMKSLPKYRQDEVKIISNPNNIGIWTEDSRRVHTRSFDYGINNTVVEMIRLIESNQYKMLYAQLSNFENDDWIFACAAVEIYNNMRFCSKATPLNRHINKLPSIRERKYFVYLDLHEIRNQNPTWTHVLLRLSPTTEKVQLNIDIFDPADRTISIPMPKWYTFTEKVIMTDTIRGGSAYEIQIQGLHESYQSLAIQLTPRSCTKSSYQVVTQICVPWARGCEKYQIITNEENKPLYVYVSKSKPHNNSNNFVLVKLHLDPSCRYIISYKNSLGSTLSRIGQQYFQWLPAHLTAILLLGLRYQISLTPDKAAFKCGKLHVALFSSFSFFIITATRVLGKLLYSATGILQPDSLSHSMLISVIIHGFALALLALLTATLWVSISFGGNLFHSTLLKLIELPLPTMSSAVMNMIEKIPISAGVLLISIASASCGGIALICGCFIYFFMIMKQYEDYLEAFIHGTAKKIALKLFGAFADRFLKTKLKQTKEETQENKTENEEKEREIVGNNEQEDNQNITEENLDGPEEPLVDETNNARNMSPDNEAISNENQNLEQTLKIKEYNSIHEGISSINFHMALFLLFLIVTVLNIPSVLTWAKNYRYSQTLSPDPSLIPAIVIIVCMSLLWQFSTPRNVYGYSAVAYFLYICACISVLYCQDSVYRLNNIISIVFFVITIHQLCAPKREVENEEDEDEDIEKILKNKILSVIKKLLWKN